MMRLLSAIILGGSLVIGAFLMRPPRYEEFPVDNSANRVVHGVFDNRTGEVCYHVSGETPEGQLSHGMICGSHP